MRTEGFDVVFFLKIQLLRSFHITQKQANQITLKNECVHRNNPTIRENWVKWDNFYSLINIWRVFLIFGRLENPIFPSLSLAILFLFNQGLALVNIASILHQILKTHKSSFPPLIKGWNLWLFAHHSLICLIKRSKFILCHATAFVNENLLSTHQISFTPPNVMF